MSQSRQSFEVNSIPEKEKYIKNSLINDYLVKPFSTRAAWLATIVLSGLSTVPLSGKLLLNLMNSATDSSSLDEAKKNAMGILAIPFICAISGVATLSPSMIGGRIARGVVLPIIPAYTSNISDIKSVSKRFPQKYFRTVKGFNGIHIDSADIPLESKEVQRYRLVFQAAAEMYQLSWEQIKEEGNLLQCNTRVFNYPGITQNNSPGSSRDLVNAGIAQVYDLAKKMKWTNAELEKHLHFYGYCLGGSVGLQVAAYFKEKHGINFCIFVDRSFAAYSDAMAGMIYAHSGVPLPLAKAIATTFLYAGGDLDLDSVNAIKKLDPNWVHYINVASETPKNPESAMEQIKHFLGIGHVDKGDGILLKDVTLTAALEREGIQCGKQTSDILVALGIQDHFVYSESKKGHFGTMKSLFNANNYYKNVVMAHEDSLVQSESKNESGSNPQIKNSFSY